MSNRTDGDARALAVSFARVSIDPTVLATDLSDARAAIKQALKTLEVRQMSLRNWLRWHPSPRSGCGNRESRRSSTTPICR